MQAVKKLLMVMVVLLCFVSVAFGAMTIDQIETKFEQVDLVGADGAKALNVEDVLQMALNSGASLADTFTAATAAGVTPTVFMMAAPSSDVKDSMVQVMVAAGIDDQTIAVAMIATGTPSNEVVAILEAAKPAGVETTVDLTGAYAQAVAEQGAAAQLVGKTPDVLPTVDPNTPNDQGNTDIPNRPDHPQTDKCDQSVSPVGNC